MFSRNSRSDANAQLAAIGRSQAVIEFAMDGTIIIYDSDYGTHGASHAIYALGSGHSAVPRPSAMAAPDRPQP